MYANTEVLPQNEFPDTSLQSSDAQGEIQNNPVSTNDDCIYEMDDKEHTLTKVEPNTPSLKIRIKISNKMRDYLKSNDKYEPHFIYMLEDPTTKSVNQISFSEIKDNKNLEKCQLKENGETPEYYLCKYKKVETIQFAKYLQDNLSILNITDIHHLLLDSVIELSKHTKIVNMPINMDSVAITPLGIPVIMTSTNALDLSEWTLDTFAESLTMPDETKCIELQILYFLGEKKKQVPENWASNMFTESDMMEIYSKVNQSQHPPREKMVEHYVNKTYGESYEKTRESSESWDAYSVTYLFWKWLSMTQGIESLPFIENYRKVLEEFLIQMPNERLNKNIFERMAEMQENPQMPPPPPEPQQNTFM